MTLTAEDIQDSWVVADRLTPKLRDPHTAGLVTAAHSTIVLLVFAIATGFGLQGVLAGALALATAYAVARYDCSIEWRPHYKAVQSYIDEVAKRRA